MAGSPSDSYQLVYRDSVHNQLREWAGGASAAARQRLAQALKDIERHLTTIPLTWGEPCFRLRQVGLAVYDGFVARIQVHYAVDTERRIVYVMELRLLSGNPLDPTS